MVFGNVVAFFLFSSVLCTVALVDDLNNTSDVSYWEKFAKNLAEQAKRNLSSLDDIGTRITQEVHDGLRPVREMQFKFRIKTGDRGTTVATFKDRRFIIRDVVTYECDGTISITDGSCYGTIHKASFNNRKDFCYAKTNVVSVNNWSCISNSPTIFAYNHGKPSCRSVDKSPSLLITTNEYRNLCGSEEYPVTYKYFTTEIGEHGSDVHCSDNKPYVCTLTENQEGEVVYSIGSNICTESFIFLTIFHILFLQIMFA